MNVVIPMVGEGRRFKEQGFVIPKPLILVMGKCIVQHAIESLGIEGKYIFIIRKNEYSHQLKMLLKTLKKDCKIIEIDYLTEGSVSSILLAENLIDNDEPLITTNCDQRTDWDMKDFISKCSASDVDGVVVTYPYEGIKLNEKSPYSFIELDKTGKAVRTEEKYAISDLALCGIHYWKHGKDFVQTAKEMIKNNDRINNEFYVAKTYNYLIKKNKKVINYHLEKDQFFSLGTPEDVKKFSGIKNEFQLNKPSTIFCDLDGTILKHLHSFSDVSKVKPELLPGVSKKLDEWDSIGHKIILVTARKESAREMTERHLRELGVPYDKLIMGVASGDRVLINDNISEKTQRAKSLNLQTNEGFEKTKWSLIGL